MIAVVPAYYLLSPKKLIYLFLPNLPFLLLWLFHSLFLKKANQLILPLVAFLTNLGLINLLQIDESFFLAQLKNLYFAFLLSVLIIIAFQKIGNIFYYRFTLGLVALVLFLLPLLIGKEVYGARLWVSLGGYSFQPTEIARFFFLLFLAGYFGEHYRLLKKESGLPFEIRLAYLIPALLMSVFSLLLLIVVKDLGFSLLILSIFLVMLYLVTENSFYIYSSLGLFFLGAYAAYRFFSHVKNRIDIWLNPWSDPFGKSYQLLQSLFAYAEGGITGTGLQHGFPHLLPAAHTDMVLPVWTESTGFLGALLLLKSVYFLCLLLLHQANQNQNQAAKIYLAGVGFSLFFQTFLVASGTMGLLPLTGLTIPFVSYGGSSLTASFLMVETALLFTGRKSRWIVS
jgi:peptidoglycan glycosyltransferase